MEQIGFIGAYDKKDLLLYIGKIFTQLNLKVLIIDATSTQRLRYVVPSVNAKGISFISEYQGIDVALGFMNLMGIANYLGTKTIPYDLILIDTDNIQTFNSFGIGRFRELYVVTSYDKYDMNKLKEILCNIPQPIAVTKVIVSSNINNNTEKHFDYMLEHETKAKPNNEVVEIADSVPDRRQVLENQLANEIVFKKFSETYKQGLEYLAALMIDSLTSFKITQNDIRKVIRRI